MKYLMSHGRVVCLLLLVGLIVQIVTCVTQLGYFHPDAHFQIVEFAGQLLGPDHEYHHTWEYESRIRPTLAIYIYAGLHGLCEAVGISHHFSIHMVSRLLVGVISWYIMSILILRVTERYTQVAVLLGLASLHFLWYMPFIRSHVSSEQISAVFLISALLIGNLYSVEGDQHRLSVWRMILSGALMSCAFYSRFQIAFALIGVGIWILIKHAQRWKVIGYLAIGFLVASAGSTALDSLYYREMVCTPYEYFYANIVEGVASTFGTSPWYYYIVELLIVFGLPILSIGLAIAWLRSLKTYWSSVFVLLFVCFVIGHSLVGHKEERFMFPVLWCIPIFLAQMVAWYRVSWESLSLIWRRLLSVLVVICGVLNIILLVAGMTVNYAQPLHFTKNLHDYMAAISELQGQRVRVAYMIQSPIATPSQLPIKYYGQDLQEVVELVRVENMAQVDTMSVDYLVGNVKYLIRKSTQDPDDSWMLVDEGHPFLDWINEILISRRWGTVDDLWRLYERK